MGLFACAGRTSAGLEGRGAARRRRWGLPSGDYWERYEAERVVEKRALVVGAHEAYGPFIRELHQWNCVMTGTYDPRRRPGARETVLGAVVHPRVSCSKALRDAERLWRFARDLSGGAVPAVFCAEPHLDSSYHIHGALWLPDARDGVFSGLQWWWFENYGFCRFRRVQGRSAVSDYLGKHLAQPMADVWFSPDLKRE